MCCVSLLASSMLATGGILSVHNHHHTPVTLLFPSLNCHPPIPITHTPASLLFPSSSYTHHQPPSPSHPITNPPNPHIPSPTPLTLTSHHQPPSPSPIPSWMLDGPRSLRQMTSSLRRMHTSRMPGKSSRVALTR